MKHRKLFLPGLLVALVIAWVGQTLPLAAQTTEASGVPVIPVPTLPTNPLQASQIVPATPDSYKIGPNDLLAVLVFQMPELNRQVRVSSNGDISLPFFPRSVRADGLTPPQLQQTVANGLVSAGISRNPIVQVAVVEVASKPIVVGGAVQHPLTLQAARPMSLLEALARAGGPTPQAGDAILVSATVNGKNVAHSYSLHALQDHDQRENPWLTGDEMVTVMSAQMIYVVGSFREPGAFPLRSGEPIDVVRAIALAKGMTGSPNRGKAQIIRAGASGVGASTVTPIDIGRILKHQAPDPEMHAGDILYVPSDTRRVALMAALTDAAQVLTLGAAYHFP